MKKMQLLKAATLTLAFVLVMCSLAACGGNGPSGKYTSELFGATVEFKAGNKVVCTYEKIDFTDGKVQTENAVSKGTYKIDGEKIVFEMDDAECLINGENSFSQGKDYVKIDGVTFTRSK